MSSDESLTCVECGDEAIGIYNDEPMCQMHVSLAAFMESYE